MAAADAAAVSAMGRWRRGRGRLLLSAGLLSQPGGGRRGFGRSMTGAPGLPSVPFFAADPCLRLFLDGGGGGAWGCGGAVTRASALGWCAFHGDDPTQGQPAEGLLQQAACTDLYDKCGPFVVGLLKVMNSLRRLDRAVFDPLLVLQLLLCSRDVGFVRSLILTLLL